MLVRCLAVFLLGGGVSGSVAVEDYPVVDATVPAFEATATGSYVDDIPIVQDSIAAPWETLTRLSGPRCGCDGLAVPEGW
jgi:hypothetical protein